MSRSVKLMKKREKEILKTILDLSEKTKGFTKPRILIIGGYALRTYIRFSRYTRDCDFILLKKNGWNLDELKKIIPNGFDIEKEEKRDNYGFMKWVKYIRHDKLKIKIAFDFMEGEIRGREKEEVILIDKGMFDKSRVISIPIAEKEVKIHVPDYRDYLITKIVSSRASDIRDIASLVHENGIPSGLKKRVKEILPYPQVFRSKITERIIPEIKGVNFINSWKGIFATKKYTEKDRKIVLKRLRSLV